MDTVITDPTCKLVNPIEKQWSIPIYSMICRYRVAEAILHNMHPRAAVAQARLETRIRGDNTWLIEKVVAPKIALWQYAILPKGKRVILIFPNTVDDIVEALDRDTLMPITASTFRLTMECPSARAIDSA
ncbi:MAG: hypothetical protein P4L69_13470, partial [Desulfosporosinus sp.]|nr:hypothetical protein [Desulfosporosinus sp.]